VHDFTPDYIQPSHRLLSAAEAAKGRLQSSLDKVIEQAHLAESHVDATGGRLVVPAGLKKSKRNLHGKQVKRIRHRLRKRRAD
jgi:hypothetical protein